MQSKKRFSVSVLFAVALLLSACAGGRGDIRFDSLVYPASMSGYLNDSHQRVVSPKSLAVVGEFKEEARLWGAVFSWVPVTKTVDVSNAMNREIAAAGGEGMINVKVTSDGCAMNYVPVMSLLPMWPGCADVTIEGQIVKQQRASEGTKRAGR